MNKILILVCVAVLVGLSLNYCFGIDVNYCDNLCELGRMEIVESFIKVKN